MISENVMGDEVAMAQWSEIVILNPQECMVLDVRRADERQEDPCDRVGVLTGEHTAA